MAALAPVATAYAPRGMVATPDHLASGAGVAALRAGGTAADAAVAAGAVLAVVAQHQCGLGGDLWALVHRSGDPAPAALNASGRAGSGADPGRLRAAGRNAMPAAGEVCVVPVPGCVDGWLALHERFGALALELVLEPARRYADDGFPMSATLALAVPEILSLAGGEDFAAAGPPRPGATVRRPGVARALAAIAARGRAGFYEGEFGAGLLALGGGEFTPADLERRQADWVAPLGLAAFGRRLWSVPPNSQGYLTLAAAWIADGLDLPRPDDGRWAHLLVEASREAAADRDEVLHEGADGEALLARGRLAVRRDAIDPERAGAGLAAVSAGDTAAVVALDGDGLGVSLVQSNFSGWGAMLAVPGTGIFLHCRGKSFSLAPGHPAEYGPGRRPPHTLAPALATDAAGGLDALLATMGGFAQPQILLQLLARSYAAGQDPAAALAAPRFVLDGDAVAVEEHAPVGWLTGLGARGHRVAPRPAWSHPFGHAQLIRVRDGVAAGAADPRSLGGAAQGL